METLKIKTALTRAEIDNSHHEKYLERAGDFLCPVLGKCNIQKAFQNRRKAEVDEYEAFNRMHTCNGTNGTKYPCNL